jgi:hypothetical protein
MGLVATAQALRNGSEKQIMANHNYDLMVIGSGLVRPEGAFNAAKLRNRVAVIEHDGMKAARSDLGTTASEHRRQLPVYKLHHLGVYGCF